MPDTKKIAKESLPQHDNEGDEPQENGTPIGSFWRRPPEPVPGSLSGGATGYEENAAETAEGELTRGERAALRASTAGSSPRPGDLTHESQYERHRDAGLGGEEETDTERAERFQTGAPMPAEEAHRDQ